MYVRKEIKTNLLSQHEANRLINMLVQKLEKNVAKMTSKGIFSLHVHGL